ATLLYLAASLTTVGAIGANRMAQSHSPLVEAAKGFTLPGASLVTSIGAATAMLGVLLSQLLAISRMMLAMARRRDLPHSLAHVRESTAVPDFGIVVSGLLIIAIAWFGSIPLVAAAASFAILLYYAIANVCALRQP